MKAVEDVSIEHCEHRVFMIGLDLYVTRKIMHRASATTKREIRVLLEGFDWTWLVSLEERWSKLSTANFSS